MPNRTAADMMTRAIVTLSPDTDIGVAIRCLLRNRITGAPVVDVTGRLVGILSEKDCLRVFVEEEGDKPSARAVADYMSTPKAKASILPTTNLLRYRQFVSEHAVPAAPGAGQQSPPGRTGGSCGRNARDRVHSRQLVSLRVARSRTDIDVF